MPTFLRIMEALSCSMAGILPYLLLIIYPYRNHLRLKNFLAGLLTIAMTAVLLRYDLASALGMTPMTPSVRLLTSVAFLIFTLVVVRAPVGKVLLSSCTVINLYALIGAAADCFAPVYTLRHFVITAVLQLILLIPYALILVKRLGPTLCISNARVWQYLWIIPTAGTASACVMHLTGISATMVTAAMVIVIVLSAVIAAVELHKTKTEMITLILRKEKPAKKVASAAPAVQMPDPVQTHYSNLMMRLAEADHNNQALLLQIMSMEDDLNQENYEQVLNRLNFLRKQLSATCDPTGNSRIDRILTYYTRQAMLSGIKIVSSVTLPEMSAVTDEHAAVMIACLMDHAMDACRQQSGGTRRIAVATHISEEVLQIGVKNTYTEQYESDGDYLDVCRSIAQCYGGTVQTFEGDGVMQTVVALNI